MQHFTSVLLSALAVNCSRRYLGSGTMSGCQRLGPVMGTNDQANEIIHCARTPNPVSDVVFFGGDVQDYRENMAAHRDNVRYVAWDLESTGELLQGRFPDSHVWLVKPATMHLKTFSVYSHFLNTNHFGNPDLDAEPMITGAWIHLNRLLVNAKRKFSSSTDSCSNLDSSIPPSCDQDERPVVLIGFSKGCIVLNQLLYELKAVKPVQTSEANQFFEKVTDMIWLDGGHSGGSNTWMTDPEVLQGLVGSKVKVHCHVTPYQVRDPMRRWIGKEQKKFVEKLKELGIPVTNTLHLEQEDRCIENHFQVLKLF